MIFSNNAIMLVHVVAGFEQLFEERLCRDRFFTFCDIWEKEKKRFLQIFHMHLNLYLRISHKA